MPKYHAKIPIAQNIGGGIFRIVFFSNLKLPKNVIFLFDNFLLRFKIGIKIDAKDTFTQNISYFF
jgi:hypothetical protein